MIEYVRNFMEFCYPGIDGYPLGKPMIKKYQVIKENKFNPAAEEVIFFCIHRVTDIFNDEWEIKEDTFFVMVSGKIYILLSVTTNYDQKVVIHSDPTYDFDKEEINLCYGVKNDRLFITEVIPKSKWKPIELILEIIETPEGDKSENIRKLFIGEKFPIDLRDTMRYPATRKDECVLIPKQDVIKVLIKSGKTDMVYHLPEQGDYIAFNKGCYKMY